MPINSNQISGMVGGQMAMFSNQAQFSQQIGGMVGTSPQGMAGGGMSNPYPGSGDMGAQVAGGMGMALPAVGTGMGMAGMIMGGKMGWMDPFTAGARGFAGGTGMAGAGAMQTLGHVGRTFASGGLRAGLGVLGGGAMGAAAAAAPALAIGAGLQFVGENVYQGAQNIAEVGGMANQYFGSQHGQAGARGGQMARQEIQRVTGALREIVDDDTKTSMEELKRVMDQAGRMGMLGGIGSAQEFKQKFQGMVRQMRQVADFMGSSLEEVAPLMGQMKQMGLWSAGDVMGTMGANKAMGAAAPNMMATMQGGAQMSHAMGGDLRSGALIGQAQFGAVHAARNAGILSERDIMEYSGGRGGAEGQQAVAERMTGLMSRLVQSPGQRLMMAALGKTDEEGGFTGETDEGMMDRFKRGEISINQLQNIGMKKTRGKRGALSFHRVQHRLGQDMVQQGGMEAFGQMINQVADRIGGPREEVQHRLLMQMGNMNERDAEMMQKLLADLPQIRDQQARSAKAAIDRAFDDAERKRGRGWDNFKSGISRQWEQFKEPFQQMGERLATDFGEMGDNISDMISGHTRRIPMGTQERMRLMRKFDAGEAMSALPSNMGQDWATGDWADNMGKRMREPGAVWRTLGAMATGGAVGAASGFGIGGVAGAFGGLGQQMFGIGEEMTPQQRALQQIGAGGGGNIDLGGGVSTSLTQMQKAVRGAYKRAQAPASMVGDSDADQARLGKWQSTLGKVVGKHSRELSRLKKEDPKKYTDRVLELMKEEGAPTGGMDRMEQLNFLAAAQQKEGFGGSELAVDFKGMARDVGLPPQNPKEMAELQDQMLNDMVTAGGGVNIGEAMLQGAAVGGLAAGMFTGGVGTAIGAAVGAIGGGIAGAIADTGITKDMVEQAMTGAGSDIFSDWASGNMSIDEARTALTRIKGGDKVRQMLDKIQDNGLEGKFQKLGPQFEKLRAGQAWMEGLQDIRGIAAGTSENLRGVSRSTQARYKSLRSLMAGGEDDTLDATEWGTAQTRAEELARDLTDEDLKSMKGQRGGISGMLQAIRAAQDFGESGGVVDKKGIASLKKKFQGFGLDLDTMGGERMAEMLRDDEISTKERPEFEKLLKGIAKSGIGASAEAAKSHTERMNELLMNYTGANTAFVKAVHEALGDKIQNAHDKVVAAQKSATNTQ